MSLQQRIFGKTGDSTIQVPRVDAISHVLETIDYAHHEIHDGKMFMVQYGITTGNDADAFCIALKTPATTPICHMFWDVSCSAPATFRVCELTTLDVDEGTEADVINCDRNSANTSLVLSSATAPVAGHLSTYSEAQMAGANFAAGTVVVSNNLAAGGKTGGSSRSDFEIILKVNTRYAFTMAAVGEISNIMSMTLKWYEQTPRTA
jgi:hypothetical protein